ncbi:MAG: HAD family hydrolase [Candidatus Aminicenantaceae bacterium]
MIKAVIFDMDGTIVEAPYNWKQIKAKLNTEGKPILSYLDSLNGAKRDEKWEILERIEDEATKKAVIKEGIVELLDFLTEGNVKKALVTNNSKRNVIYLLKKFKLDFDLIISREYGLWKPSGAPFIAVMDMLKVSKEECCVVGDSPFDIEAAMDSGINKIFIVNDKKHKLDPLKAEIFDSLQDLHRRLEQFIEEGK